jgi:hypothetical protein
MEFKFTINNETFYIEEYEGGFAWVNDETQGDGFPTIAEAQQNAMDYVRIRDENIAAAKAQAEDDAKYGTDEEQWARDYREAVRVS